MNPRPPPFLGGGMAGGPMARGPPPPQGQPQVNQWTFPPKGLMLNQGQSLPGGPSSQQPQFEPVYGGDQYSEEQYGDGYGDPSLYYGEGDSYGGGSGGYGADPASMASAFRDMNLAAAGGARKMHSDHVPSFHPTAGPGMGAPPRPGPGAAGGPRARPPPQMFVGGQPHNGGAPYFEPMAPHQQPPQHAPAQQMYYGQADPTLPLQYHLYTGPPPHSSNLPANLKTVNSFFMSDHLREQLQRRSEATLASLDPSSPEAISLPPEVHTYHSLYPLEPEKASDKFSKVFRLPVHTYKAVNAADGQTYCLRRVEGFRLTNTMAMTAVEAWRRIGSSSVVVLREAFTTKQFGDSSLVFVYDYHPLSETLYRKQFGSPSPPLSEGVLWSFIVQIAAGIRAVHATGRACRTLDHSKILITGQNRVRLNCLGMADVLAFDGGKNTAAFQQEDLIAFGNLIVSLACNSLAAVQNIPNAIEYVGRQFSPELKNLIIYLLGKPSANKSIDEVASLLGPRLLNEVNASFRYADELEGELLKEVENGRLVRLLCKLGFINERPEFDMDPSWSETGDRYLLKLFRDYVFHQVDEQGDPVINLAHVITCLNKLDAGHAEQIRLMSRDEQTCLVVSYKDLKQCIDTAFRDLVRRKAHRGPSLG